MSAPIIIRLSDRQKVRELTGFSSTQLRRLAITEGCPVIVRGEGRGKREFIELHEWFAWFRATSRRLA